MLQFSEIETRRAKAGIEQNQLCDKAGVHAMTYSKLKNRPGKRGATEDTLKKLKSALDDLVEEKLRDLKETGGQGHG